MYMALDFRGSVDLPWTCALIVLTLPCSLISIFFAWSLIHGASLEFFAFIYLASACLNVFVVNQLISTFRKARQTFEELNHRKPSEAQKPLPQEEDGVDTV
jgi:predicted membrane channel-forming protein YqfA (hemolysin III family)